MADPTKELRGDIGTAQSLYKQYLPNGQLGTLNTGRTGEQNALGAVRWSAANPAYASYAGNMTADAKEILNMRKSQLDKNSSNYAGATSDSHRQLLAQRRAASDPNSASYAGNRSMNMRDIISRFRSGLDGYTASENAALLGAARSGVDSQYGAERSRMVRDQARARVGGAASIAGLRDLSERRLGEERMLNRDLTIQNIDEKQNRLKAFAGLMTDAERDEYARGQEATSEYERMLRDSEGTAYNRVQDALAGYQNYQTEAENTAYGRGQEAIAQYQNYLNYLNEQSRAAEAFNIEQSEKEQSRDVGGVMGLLGLLQSRRSAQEQNKILGKK